MLKKSKITIVLVLVVSFLMNSCHKEEELESIDTQTTIKKRNISFEELNTKLNKYKKYKVHQGRAGGGEFITSLETDNIIEIATEDKTTYTLKANTTADDATSFTNIIFVEKNGQLEKYLLKYEPTEAWKTARLTDANISYSGDNIILDFDGNVLAESQVVDGITVSKTSASMTCYVFEWYSDVINLESYYTIVEVPCDEPTDTEIDAGDSGDGGGVDTSGDGDGSTTSGTGTDGDNGGNSNDNETGDTADTGDDGDPIFTEPVFGDNDGDEDLLYQLNEFLCTPISINQFNDIDIDVVQQILEILQNNPLESSCVDVDFEDKVINALEGKEKCIYNHLNDGNNNFFDELIDDFTEETSEFSITYISEEHVIHTYSNGTTAEVNGLTRYFPGTNKITIYINSSSMGAAKALDVVRTILHETIHAEMLRRLNTINPTNEDIEFRETYNSYENTKFEPTQQHQTMAALYVDKMAVALEEFHREKLVGDYNYLTDNGTNPLPYSFYEAIAWRGLKSQNVQAYIDLTQEEKDAMEEVLILHHPTTTSNCP